VHKLQVQHKEIPLLCDLMKILLIKNISSQACGKKLKIY
jgi:hypothetical protein